MFKNKEGKVRSGWKIAGVTGALFIGTALISIILGIFIFLYLLSTGNFQFETMQFSEYGNRIMNNFNLIIMFLSELVMIFTPIIAWKFIMKRNLTNMGLSSFIKHYKDLFIGLLFGITSMTFVFAAIVISGNAEVKTWTPSFSADTVIYLIFFILVGFAEEIYGRGFIMSSLRQTRSIPVVVIISSLIFSLLHSANSGISLLPYLNIFLVGILFAYMYLKSGNIWTGIGYHITWNYFQGIVFGFKVSGIDTKGLISTVYKNDNIWNGGAFGPEGGLFVTIIILVGIIVVNLLFRNRQFDFIATEPDPVSRTEINEPMNPANVN